MEIHQGMISNKIFNNVLRSIVLSIAGLLFQQKSIAQNKPYSEISVTAPTAASLGKFTDIPVSYHTGLPQIDIPFYSVKAGPLSLPISLSYHAGGLKVMEPASWVGTGWTLNAGGVINRTVRGAPDEALNTGTGIYGHFKDYGYSNYLTTGGGSGSPCATGLCPYDQAFANGTYDGEPDLFFFNFAGYSGKFYFNDDRTAILLPDQNIKVEYYFPADTAGTVTAKSANIQGFILTTPDGTRYYFGINSTGTASGADPVETIFPYTANHSNPTDAMYSSWYLNKIESADGLFVIKLTYQAESYSYYTISMHPVSNTILQDANPTNDYEYDLGKNFIQGVRLSQISFPNGRIDFTGSTSARTDLSSYTSGWNFTDVTNTDAKSLSSISISDSVNFCKKYSFYYSYFTDNTSSVVSHLAQATISSDKYRLRLDSIKEQVCDGSIINPPYRFDYFTGLVPRRLSLAQDHWGFYNGATSNTSLIPTYTIDTFTFINGANRDSKWPEMRNGALSKITYPTGGSNSYDFEPNTTWISTTRYTNVLRNTYTVGYDGNNNAAYNGVTLTNNHYQITVSNNTCPSGSPSCDATVYVKKTDGTVMFFLTAQGGQSATSIMQIPAGTYNITMFRGATQTGTGGSAYFYEVLSSVLQKNDSVGGLRIKTITQSDSVSSQNNVVTNFAYDVNGHSSGILYSRPTYVQVIRNKTIDDYGFGGSFPNPFPNGCLAIENPPSIQPYFISPCPVMPMTNTQGNHIGYNEVKVSQTNNGWSIYRYYGSNLWDLNDDDVAYRNVNPKQCSTSIPYLPEAPLPFEYNRGSLKYEGQFNQSGNVLHDKTYTYYYDSSKILTHAYKESYIDNALLGIEYDLTTYWRKEADVVDIMYNTTGGSASTTTRTYYGSPYHRYPTRNVSLTSNGDSLITISKYAFDYRISNCDTISDGWQTYLNACTTCNTTMQQQIASATDLTHQLMYWRDNKVCRANARKALVTLRRNNFTNPTNNFKTCFTTAKNGANTELKPVLQLKDDNNNQVIEVSNWRNNQLTSAFFYDYDFSTLPTNEVYINKAQAVNLAATTTTFTTSSNTATALTKDSRYEDESIYKFLSGNPADAKGRDGINKSYIWDYSNSVPVAIAVNATDDQVAFTSFESGGKGNWNNYTGTITTATTAATMPPTGTSYYNLTTSATLSKGSLTSGKKYIVSYWTKNTGTFSITGVSTNTSVSGKTINGWTYYEHTVTASGTTITLSGTGTVDEVRLYPADAQMTTYTYQPLLGITSQCDVNNRINYYTYDALGRLSFISDQDKYVLKKFCYNYDGQPVNCDNAGGDSGSGNVTVSITNTTGLTGFTVSYSQSGPPIHVYSLTVNSPGPYTLTVPAGTYTLTVSRAAGNAGATYTTCSPGITTDCGVTLNNVTVSSSSCNSVSINNNLQ